MMIKVGDVYRFKDGLILRVSGYVPTSGEYEITLFLVDKWDRVLSTIIDYYPLSTIQKMIERGKHL